LQRRDEAGIIVTVLTSAAMTRNMYNPTLQQMKDDGLLDEGQVGQIQARLASGCDLDTAIREESPLDEDSLLEYCVDRLHMPRAQFSGQETSRDLLEGIPARILLTWRILPLWRRNGWIGVATSRPLDPRGLDELRLVCDLEIEPALASGEEISRRLNTLLGVGADTMEVLVNEAGQAVSPVDAIGDVELDDGAEDASIITFVNQVLVQALDRRATDVHIEPFENSLRVRFRVDGVLQEAPIPREVRRFHAAIVSRLKILAQLDIAEKRVPQDGRVKLRFGSREVDVRVSVIPMLHGEAVVLRLLDRAGALLGLERLGMSDGDRRAIDEILNLPHGIVLVTGPTGSGKTTTLYACLTEINGIERKIVTIEDPIEYHLEGINQIQIASKAGLTFARGLRAVLRHDPDVILLGEIRDEETAEIAVQASLTGHLVFSTLHTNDAPSAPVRLIDMGIEPYLVASSVEMIMAQRLVRTICPDCRETYLEELAQLRDPIGEDLPDTFVRGRGCESCGHTGYQGRMGIFEILPITEPIRALILQRAASSQIRTEALRAGMRTLRQDGLRLVRQGLTTIDEVLRVSKDEVREACGE
jgi:general secretion pathway protein E/type IV pilus assembly protein PilB